MPRSTTTSKPRSFVVIPARYASTRLPRKMLLRETGKTLLQHTYESACAARKPAGVVIVEEKRAPGDGLGRVDAGRRGHIDERAVALVL